MNIFCLDRGATSVHFRVQDRRRVSYESYKSLLAHKTSVINSLTSIEQAQEKREQILNTLTRYETASMYNLQGQLLLYEGKKGRLFSSLIKFAH
ncbi:MAG: hypothetical protein GY801_41695 [bacterium]|nr:hypothetical protein [bacterium]